MRRTTVVAIAVLAAAGCGGRGAERRSQRLEAERRQLADTFDRLEDRLIVNQARVRFWREMRDRHESISAISCASQDRHAEEMAAHLVDPARPERVARRPARVVARYVEPPVPGGSGRAAPLSRPPPGMGGMGGN